MKAIAPDDHSPLLGVVLSGGESRRMGRDKGLLDTAGKPWVLLMGDLLRQQQLPVVYSIRQSQLPAYSAVLPGQTLIIDDGRREGPLNGLFTVHRRFPQHDLLLLACDMQDLDAPTLETLLTAWSTPPAAEAYAYEVEGMLQPFCAIYGASLLAKGDTTPSCKSPGQLLRSGAIRRLEGRVGAFRNYNSFL